MKKFIENLEQWKDDPSLRMDRCAVNKTYATADFDLQPLCKHLDAAFCSNMSKTETWINHLFKRCHYTYLSMLAQSAFQMFEKCCNLCLLLSSKMLADGTSGDSTMTNFCFFVFFTFLSIKLFFFFNFYSASSVASFNRSLKPSRMHWHVSQCSIFQIILWVFFKVFMSF